VGCHFHDFFTPTDPRLGNVGKDKGLGDWKSNALKKDIAWEMRYDGDGGGLDAVGNGVLKNDKAPSLERHDVLVVKDGCYELVRKVGNGLFWLFRLFP
jgi:hypothetical protein